jgi:predicted dehydrogenase
MKLRVGLVGLGSHWDTRHQPALRALSDRFEVKAICAEVALAAKQAAASFGACVMDGYQALAAREDIDALMLLAPQWFGPLPILAACSHGKAVYAATAMDIEPELAASVRQRVAESGVAFMAEFPRRLAPATIRLKELIATRLGQPHLLFCHRRLTAEQGNGGVRRSRCSTAQRELLELVDWCCYAVGREPESVLGIAHCGVGDEQAEHYRMMSLQFRPEGKEASGPLAQISCGHYIPAQWPEASTFRPPAAMQVCCERGVAFIDLPANLVWFDEAGRHMESLDHERPVGERLLLQFHRCVTSLVQQTSSLDDACRAIQVVQAAGESAHEGKRVLL